jgi:DNA-binding NarL/FixJ family response regulator
MAIKVLLVDDLKIMREGLKTLLDSSGDIEVVAQAANGEEALTEAEKCRADVIVMDLTMPKMGGIEATRKILAGNPTAKILALSMVLDKSCLVASLKAGAKGYLIKDCADNELIEAIRRLAEGRSYLCAKITELIVREYAQSGKGDASQATGKRSRREQDVLRLQDSVSSW